MDNWHRMYDIWNRLYYCARDDCVFDPTNNEYAPIEEINRIYKPQANIQNKIPSNQDEAIWLSLKKYYITANKTWLKSRVIAEIKKYLASDELPEGVIFGQHPDTGVGGGGLWVTNKRLLYVGQTFWRKPIIIECPYSQINSIDFVDDKIILNYENRQVAFKNVDKLAQVWDFIRLVNSRIT